ncbi:MAG: hypothetical protein J2P19_30805 [Pseudonocardia sp.]|nr:hypothetical protein [Pseudonocardia sp.]
MRVLPRVVVPLAAVSMACLLGVTGCAQFNKSLGQQQAFITFKDGTPVAVKLQVRTACSKLPHVSAAPLAKSVPLSSAVDQVVYRVTGASNADLARLQVCLSKFPSVQGMDIQDATDDT